MNSAVEEVEKVSGKEVHIAKPEDNKCVMFDIAVTVENTAKDNVEDGIKVLGVKLGRDSAQEAKSSAVSRITFGVYLNFSPKKEVEARRQSLKQPKSHDF